LLKQSGLKFIVHGLLNKLYRKYSVANSKYSVANKSITQRIKKEFVTNFRIKTFFDFPFLFYRTINNSEKYKLKVQKINKIKEKSKNK